jgi:DNA-directed RNA polymerase subunit M/transcription elongation factor TFIIS
MGDPLHLAYNPGYTGSDEVRSSLLNQLATESKAGGRARCWNCGSIAIIYDRWQTRSKAFGEIGIAMCEICGVWSVM